MYIVFIIFMFRYFYLILLSLILKTSLNTVIFNVSDFLNSNSSLYVLLSWHVFYTASCHSYDFTCVTLHFWIAHAT